jgi:hypothetical protein
MLARQLQNTLRRPSGQGQVFDISQEEFDQHRGCFRWVSEEQEDARKQAEAAERADLERQTKAAMEARAAHVADLRQRIRGREVIQASLRVEREKLEGVLREEDQLLAKMREQLDKLLTQPIELPKPKQAVESPPEAKKPTAQKRPSIAYKPGEKVATIG